MDFWICFIWEARSYYKIYLEYHWRSSSSSECVSWCGFGGGPNEGEFPEATAAREFSEETMGIIALSNNRPGGDIHHDKLFENSVRHTLLAKDYFFRLNIHINSKTGAGVKVFFVKQVPWQPDVCDKFKATRKSLLDIIDSPYKSTRPFHLRHHPALRQTSTRIFVNPHYLEKQSINWWSVDRLTEVIQNNGRFKHERFRRSFLPVLKLVLDILSSKKELENK